MDILTVEGIVERITFYNAENGYAVFVVNPNNTEKVNEITCVGYTSTVNVGESVTIKGKVVNHPYYGKQINIETFEKTEPRSEKAIELYLSSGVIKGVGPRTAKRIVEKFGDKTLEVIDKTPEKLSKIKGISHEKAISIGKVYREKTDERNALLYLSEYGISLSYAIKIYDKYKDKTISIVNKNPYALADDIFGIGFKIADNIAENIGIPKNSPFRIKAGIKYILNQGANNGNVFLPENVLISKTAELLSLQQELVETELLNMHIENKIWIERAENSTNVYLNFFYYAEGYVSRKLNELNSINVNLNYNYDAEIDYLENIHKIKFAKQQRDAIKLATQNGVLVITGGPGTGKTTIINAIIEIFKAEGYKIELAAPTGKAAKRMKEATGHEAQTIHRLLGTISLSETSRNQSFEKNEENPIEADIIIIDESSMIDILLMHSLLKAIARGTRLILVGDSNQLPSVGPGNVLKDVINSKIISVANLTEIFRQSQQSDIVINSHKINNGEYPSLKNNKNDFYFMKRLNAVDIQNLLVELVSSRLPNYLKCDPIKDIQVLTPMRKSPLGVIELNKILQNALNPPSPDKTEKTYRDNVFREGDKIMQIKNDYNIDWKIIERGKIIDEGTGVFNGDEGIITYIDLSNEYVEILFDDNKVVHYEFTQLDKISLSYAVTIHKSQGSEYKAVIMPLLNGPEMLMSRNLLYTGLTRAKQLAVLVGSEETIKKMVDNNKEISRYTNLNQKIKDFATFANQK